ncbi:MAG: L,D-transpeptidase family protein [Legionellaceae bacterium]|nr:L,D-transpeptidase family protein [Legionellaceae bacterium]
MQNTYCLFLVKCMLFLSINTLVMAADKTNDACQILSTSQQVKMLPTSQIIVVHSLGGIKASMTLCQKQGVVWYPVFLPSFEAVIGENGTAAAGKKKEGDLKTPVGLYPIGDAFGTRPLALKMDYKYITADDKFIDDVHSKRYNTWVTGTTKAKSYEHMLIKPYVFGAIVNYNMQPTIAGAGSAIFIHVWSASNTGTAGCVATTQKHILQMLHWLDKAQHPYILVY